jgi:hypothetical protein
LTSVSFPDAISIGDQAFAGSSLISADFPEVTNIDSSAFYSCTRLASVNIPKVSSIGYEAFGETGNTALTITMGDPPPRVGGYVFNYVIGKTVTVRVPSGAMASYNETWVDAFKVNNFITMVIEPIGGATFQ